MDDLDACQNLPVDGSDCGLIASSSFSFSPQYGMCTRFVAQGTLYTQPLRRMIDQHLVQRRLQVWKPIVVEWYSLECIADRTGIGLSQPAACRHHRCLSDGCRKQLIPPSSWVFCAALAPQPELGAKQFLSQPLDILCRKVLSFLVSCVKLLSSHLFLHVLLFP